jgi:hypothetical protein
MAKEFDRSVGSFAPKDAPKVESKTLPTWEFFYTGTLWRLTNGQRGKTVNPVPKTVFSHLDQL